MENNAFFNAVLKGLKFSVYSTGARVSDATAGISGGGYGGWTHMVNIVKLSDGKKYMVDVGFGANVATRPLPLEEGCTCKGIFAREMRLVYENIPPNSDPTQKLWIYQYRDPPAEEWLSAFCFTEVEYLANDYTVMNFFTSHSPQSWFLKDVVILKMIMEEDELIGSLILFNGELKRKVGGKTEILEELKTEDDRLKALQSWFGIELTEVERRGIRGLVSEIFK
jgi:arylamine N-acetyltransferase